jgi:hypothetical protein
MADFVVVLDELFRDLQGESDRTVKATEQSAGKCDRPANKENDHSDGAIVR